MPVEKLPVMMPGSRNMLLIFSQISDSFGPCHRKMKSAERPGL